MSKRRRKAVKGHKELLGTNLIGNIALFYMVRIRLQRTHVAAEDTLLVL